MIAWLDIETTGLDPKKGSILEIAIILTNDDLLELGAFACCVRPIHLRGREVMDDYVVKMHTTNGLLQDLETPGASPLITPSGRGIARCGEVETSAIQWFYELVRKPGETQAETNRTQRQIPLGGNSVHFDRAWIREHMPDLERLFSHRNVDCSTLNELAKRWSPVTHQHRPGAADEPAHRAMEDVTASIKLAKFYRAELFPGAP